MDIGLVYWIHLTEHDDPHHQGYVGVTNNLQRRIREHKSKTENRILQNVFKKYKSVIIDILFIGDYEYCYDVEKTYRHTKEIGWNLNEGGKKPPNNKGIKKSLETRKKMSLNNVGFRGKKHSNETKEKMKQSHMKKLGVPHTEETKRKLSEIAKQRKNNPMLGRKHSEETKKLISLKMKNKKRKCDNPPKHPGYPSFPSEQDIIAKAQALNVFVSNLPLNESKKKSS
jgi:hypothetical protein